MGNAIALFAAHNSAGVSKESESILVGALAGAFALANLERDQYDASILQCAA